MNELKVAVVSDLHCKHSKSDTNDDTWLLSDKMRKPVNQHPIQSLIDTIRKEKIESDLLLCPGDISNKTDPQGLITGWSFLEELKTELGAKYLIASLGNHDVDSRGIYNKYDYLNLPRKLKENYPFDFRDAKKAYIADRFCFIEIDDILIFNFNSSHSHSNAESALESLITDDILEEIGNELNGLKKHYKFKIALTHHHPIMHSNVGFTYRDQDHIEKGERLVDILNSFNFQIFIHGHKHEPKITNYNGIPVFASGSISSITNLKETGSYNCFHIITLNENDKKGTIENWEYTFGVGWSLASIKLRPSFGFGFQGNVEDFCSDIKLFFDKENKSRITIDEFKNIFPDFNYLTPNDYSKVIENLSTDFDLVNDYKSGLLKEILKR